MSRQSRPHVILLMADQLRWDCLSCHGDLPVRTPHLDALAGESLVFERAYCASPLCTPTRCAMYTGKYPHTTGAIVNGHNLAAERPFGSVGLEHATLYEVLDGAGYTITQVGVQHCQTVPTLEERVPRARITGHREWQRFARGIGIEPSHFNLPDVLATCIPVRDFSNGRPITKRSAAPIGLPYPGSAEQFMDVWESRWLVEEIARMSFDNPQYLEALFWAPHPPLIVPEPYFSMYPPGEIALPENVGRWFPGQPSALLEQVCGMLGTARLREEYRGAWSAYFGLVTMVDECLGRVIEALKAKGVWDEALVVFCSDHGEMLGAHHLFQKMCFYEEAARLPLLIKPPGGAAAWFGRGSRRRALASAIDYCPTVCDYAGVPAPVGVQGCSLRRFIEQGDTNERDAVFMESNGDQGRSPHHRARAIVADVQGATWKYILNQGDVDELYCLETDPLEMRSMVEEDACQELRRGLCGRLQSWMRETRDVIDSVSLAPVA